MLGMVGRAQASDDDAELGELLFKEEESVGCPSQIVQLQKSLAAMEVVQNDVSLKQEVYAAACFLWTNECSKRLHMYVKMVEQCFGLVQRMQDIANSDFKEQELQVILKHLQSSLFEDNFALKDTCKELLDLKETLEKKQSGIQETLKAKIKHASQKIMLYECYKLLNIHWLGFDLNAIWIASMLMLVYLFIAQFYFLFFISGILTIFLVLGKKAIFDNVPEFELHHFQAKCKSDAEVLLDWSMQCVQVIDYGQRALGSIMQQREIIKSYSDQIPLLVTNVEGSDKVHKARQLDKVLKVYIPKSLEKVQKDVMDVAEVVGMLGRFRQGE